MNQATVFAHCSSDGGADCSESEDAFAKSCSQVVNGIVQGSSGDRERTTEYMANVCGQKVLVGWHKATCFSLSKALSSRMTDSLFDNRESLNARKVCDVAWSTLVEEQKKEVTREIAMRKELEQKEKEEEAEEQKAAEQKAVAEEKDKEVKRAQEVETEAEQ